MHTYYVFLLEKQKLLQENILFTQASCFVQTKAPE